jgi:CrcB protein
MTWILVGLGGAIGSMARHFTNLLVTHVMGRSVPYATFVVNVVGCILIGVLAGVTASGRLHLPPAGRAFLFVGVLGGFTTFSAFGLDTLTLGHSGEHFVAFWNVVGQIGLGLAAVFLGYRLAA